MQHFTQPVAYVHIYYYVNVSALKKARVMFVPFVLMENVYFRVHSTKHEPDYVSIDRMRLKSGCWRAMR